MTKTSSTQTAKLISIDELNQLLSKLEETVSFSKVSLRNYSIILLLADLGLRVGELVQIQMSDILIASELVRALRIRPEISKYKIERIIPISKRCLGALHQYLKESPHLTDCRNIYLFPGRDRNSDHMSARQIQLMIAKLSHLAIGRKITPHTLRHSFATRLMQVTPMPVVQELMGHSNLSSTQVYTHPTQKDLFDAIDGIGDNES